MASLVFLGIGTRFWKLAIPLGLLQPRITRIRRPRASGSQRPNSMVIPSEKRLFIQLDIPNSPLLLTLLSDADSLLSARAQPAMPCTALSHEMTTFSKMTPSISTSSGSSLIHHHHLSHSVPEITITYALSQNSLDGPLTSPPPYTSPPPKPRLSAPASKKLNEFVDFLEKVDRDMASEVEHVKQSINEARGYVREWREERSARCAELLKRRQREGREGNEPESDI